MPRHAHNPGESGPSTRDVGGIDHPTLFTRNPTRPIRAGDVVERVDGGARLLVDAVNVVHGWVLVRSATLRPTAACWHPSERFVPLDVEEPRRRERGSVSLLVVIALALVSLLVAASPALAGGSAGVDPALKSAALKHMNDVKRFAACSTQQGCIDSATTAVASTNRIIARATALVHAGHLCAAEARSYARGVLSIIPTWKRLGANPTVATRSAAVDAELRIAPRLVALVKAC